MSNRNRSKKFNSLRRAVVQEHQRRNEVRLNLSGGSSCQNEPQSNQSNSESGKRNVYDVRLLEVVREPGEKDKRPFLRTSIEGEIYRALFKTGSDISVLGPKVTEKLRKYVFPTDDLLVSLGQRVPTAGYVRLKIDIGTDVKTFDFFAATKPVFHDIILGADFGGSWCFGLTRDTFSMNNSPYQDINNFLLKATPIMMPNSIGFGRETDSPSRDSCLSDMETQSASSSNNGSLNGTATIKTEKSECREKAASIATEALVDKVLLLMEKLEVFSVETQEAVLNAIFRDKQPIDDNFLI